MRSTELEEGDCIKHAGREEACLITRRVIFHGELIGYEYVPWRDGWVAQTKPARFIKLKREYAGEWLDFKRASYVLDPSKIRIVEM